MPVILLVEGARDVQVTRPLLYPTALVEVAGSKYGLAPTCRERRDARQNPKIYLLRDRDFDYEPPAPEGPAPIEDDRGLLGWHTARHELEVYLVDPALLTLGLSAPYEECEAELTAAAARLEGYAAARWTVGRARRALPPHYRLETRPTELHDRELGLPGTTDDPSWAIASIAEHLARMHGALSPDTIATGMGEARAQLRSCSSITDILRWFPGKDLLCALTPWARQRHPQVQHPGDLRALLLRRCVEQLTGPGRQALLHALPEWSALHARLRELELR